MKGMEHNQVIKIAECFKKKGILVNCSEINQMRKGTCAPAFTQCTSVSHSEPGKEMLANDRNRRQVELVRESMEEK